MSRRTTKVAATAGSAPTATTGGPILTGVMTATAGAGTVRTPGTGSRSGRAPRGLGSRLLHGGQWPLALLPLYSGDYGCVVPMVERAVALFVA